MKKIYTGLVFLFSFLGFGQQLSEAEKKMTELAGIWKTEVQKSPLTLDISLEKNKGKEYIQISLINLTGEKFVVSESKVVSPSGSEFKINILNAGFEQYKNCKIKDAVINLKRLENDSVSFSYHSEITDCSFGNDNGLEIPDIDGLIFKKEK
ncbi:hypothetical protein [Chryseobacterium arthrosphaerae]|uniref:hypothetical protein n=1 Tax=Chryseobacterium arthrosphaerae TaxID=651561 RepID=UPI001E493C63|nr:hypothetical protein [Chryseobacterium arthrosphaerae]UEQ77014.1 hypothetical protein J8N07_01560 [Chryseobacterium arthrosphaerae]